MTQDEYEHWKDITEKSKYRWMVDKITYYNHKDFLAYKGGEDGAFIEISHDGVVSMGTYEGALPHIGEAIFKPQAHKAFESFEDAFKYVVENGGLGFLVDLFTEV